VTSQTPHTTARECLKKLSEGAFTSGQERDELLEVVVGVASTLRPEDVVWMAFRPDKSLREACARILQAHRRAETVDVFLAASKGQREAAIRAASMVLFGLRIPGTEKHLVALAESNDLKTRSLAHQLVLSAPPAPALEPLLWHLSEVGDLGARLRYLDRLAAYEANERSVKRWKRLVSNEKERIRDKALTVIADKAAEQNIDLLVSNLPKVRPDTREFLIGAISNVARGRDPSFADHLLPLMASGDSGTRSAVVSILLSMPDRPSLIRKYLDFSKTLAGWTRDRALESMKTFGPDMIDPVLELLEDDDLDIRISALLLAGSYKNPKAVPAIIPLLKDDDWWLRITAAETLGDLGDARAVGPLTELLNDTEARWAAVGALGRIGDDRALPALSQLLKHPEPEVRIEVIMAFKHFSHPRILEVLTHVATSDPNRSVQLRALSALGEIKTRLSGVVEDDHEMRSKIMTTRKEAGEPKMNALLRATRKQDASDLHLAVGEPPVIRVSARLLRVKGEALTQEQIRGLVLEILTDDQRRTLEERQQLDFCHYIPDCGRFRGNIFLDRSGYNAAFRVIPYEPPTFEEIGLPGHLEEIVSYHQGLILICGPSGNGKSTTLAALVNLFNERTHSHIITLEDPVEFVHPFKNSLVNQREVGRDTISFARALRAGLREDPDVIVIGELRDTESISLALTAAETGHVVFGTLNATSASRVVDRIISSFSAQERPSIRSSIAESLRYAIAQRLLPAKGGGRMVACFEILKSTPSIVNLIRDKKTIQIPSAMQIGQNIGMCTYDVALRELLDRDRITLETAYQYATSKKDFAALFPDGYFGDDASGVGE